MPRLPYLLAFCLIPFLFACDPDVTGYGNDGPETLDFDRAEMLANWVDNVFRPAYTDNLTANATLAAAATTFTEAPSEATLATLRTDYLFAYENWQVLSPVLTGKAEEINLRSRLNTYPTDTELIEANIRNDVNLNLPSMYAAQGFPALDYLLYEEAELLLENNDTGNARRNYVSQLIDAMTTLLAEASNEWTDNFRATFVANDGNSATASIDRTVNDYIFHYEKFLRAGKVGIPAGIFSDTPLADRAEAPYSGSSKRLMLASLAASRNFFVSEGLADYLDALNVSRDGEFLSQTVTNQFAVILAEAANVGDNFAEQVATDNSKMLALYDEMQRVVVLLKVDMLQALSINVDYVDADGD
jgi:predicted lipoprotein